MIKKMLSMLLAMIMIVTMIPVDTVSAVTITDSNYAEKVIKSLGVMETAVKKNGEASDYVSRAEYAQMLINLSVYKDSVSGTTDMSVFQDVKKSYKGASYIEFAVSNEWMSGYLNGKFQPKKAITLQEAVNGVIHLLGYMDSDFMSDREAEKLSLYTSLKLNENISKSRSEKITRKDCMNLFYNTLKATTKDKLVYATKLGYKIDADGDLEYLNVVNKEMDGPIIAESSWSSQIPFDLSSATTYYRDDYMSSVGAIQAQDVLYYSIELNTVWAYSEKVTGVLKKVAPSRLNPTGITLGKKTYTIGSQEMAYRFSTQGGLKIGDIITILLGKDDKVVGVLTKKVEKKTEE